MRDKVAMMIDKVSMLCSRPRFLLLSCARGGNMGDVVVVVVGGTTLAKIHPRGAADVRGVLVRVSAAVS